MKVVQILAPMIFGVIVGGIVAYQTVLIATNCKILYVSQDEIMKLETERVSQENLNQRTLFFGRIEEAANLASILPKSYQDRTTKIVYSEKTVTGKDVESISKKVHQRIIEELQKGITDGNNR